MGDCIDRKRQRQCNRADLRASLARFTWAALFGVHLSRWLQGEFRRVQDDGPGSIRKTKVRRCDLREPDRPSRGRIVPARSELLQLSERTHNDERQVFVVVRWSSASAGVAAD